MCCGRIMPRLRSTSVSHLKQSLNNHVIVVEPIKLKKNVGFSLIGIFNNKLYRVIDIRHWGPKIWLNDPCPFDYH